MSNPVPIRFVEGDGLTNSADLAIIGTGPRLIQEIESKGDCRFERICYPEHLVRKHGNLDGLKRSLIAVPKDIPWKNVVAFPSRPTSNPRKGLISEYFEVVIVVIRGQLRPKSVIVLPLQDRPTESSALLSLFVAWSIPRLALPGRRLRTNPEITVAALENVAVIRNFATERVQEFRDFAAKLLHRFCWSRDWSEMDAPSFEIVGDDS
jgi:hypothetical protein